MKDNFIVQRNKLYPPQHRQTDDRLILVQQSTRIEAVVHSSDRPKIEEFLLKQKPLTKGLSYEFKNEDSEIQYLYIYCDNPNIELIRLQESLDLVE